MIRYSHVRLVVLCDAPGVDEISHHLGVQPSNVISNGDAPETGLTHSWCLDSPMSAEGDRTARLKALIDLIDDFGEKLTSLDARFPRLIDIVYQVTPQRAGGIAGECDWFVYPTHLMAKISRWNLDVSCETFWFDHPDWQKQRLPWWRRILKKRVATATANITYDRGYFELQYDEWLRHRSKFKRYEIWFAVALTVLGLAMTFTFQYQWLVGAVFASAGAYEFLMAATHKRRWVNARVSAIRPDKSVQLEFDTDSLTSTSENGTGIMRISGFTEFTPASHGFFLIPDTGVSLYVPRATITPSDSYSPLIELLSSTIGRPKIPNGG